MLTNKGFIKWANEHVVVLISHNELGHEEIVDEGVTGEGGRHCPLYPGLTCRQHLDISVETSNSRDEELPVVPFIELCPNSWVIHPDGKVEAIDEAAQFTSKGVEDALKAAQKTLGDALPVSVYAKRLPDAVAAQAAFDDERWRDGLLALARLRAAVKRPGRGLRAWITLRLELVEEEVGFLFEDAIEDGDLSPAERRTAVTAQLEAVDVRVGSAYVPLRARIEAWLAAHPAVAATTGGTDGK